MLLAIMFNRLLWTHAALGNFTTGVFKATISGSTGAAAVGD